MPIAHCTHGREPKRSVYLLLLVWLAVPVLFLLRHQRPVFSYYFLILLPAPFEQGLAEHQVAFESFAACDWPIAHQAISVRTPA